MLRHNLIKIEQRRELLKTTLPMHQLPKQPPPSLWTIQLPHLHGRKVTAAASGAIHRISSRHSLPSTKLSSSSSERAAVVFLCHVSSSNDMPPIQESYASLLVISCATKLYCWRYMKANSTSSLLLVTHSIHFTNEQTINHLYIIRLASAIIILPKPPPLNSTLHHFKLHIPLRGESLPKYATAKYSAKYGQPLSKLDYWSPPWHENKCAQKQLIPGSPIFSGLPLL